MTIAEPPALHQIGSVFLYFSNENPSAIILTHSQPSMKVSLDVVHSSKSLFEALAKQYTNVTSKSELQSIKTKPIGFTSRVAYVKFPIRQCDIIGFVNWFLACNIFFLVAKYYIWLGHAKVLDM